MRIQSREVDDLRPDVAACLKYGMRQCANKGVPIKPYATYRNQEYQTWLNQQGLAPATVTFHGVRLAFDLYIDIPGHNYDSVYYINTVAPILKAIGFSWMWDIAHNEMAHFQWDEHRKYTGKMILQGNLPPMMPLPEDDMTGKEIFDALNEYLKTQPCPDWAKAELELAKAAGITDGTNPMGLIPRYQAAIMAYRAAKK
jgi:hypothetical protein